MPLSDPAKVRNKIVEFTIDDGLSSDGIVPSENGSNASTEITELLPHSSESRNPFLIGVAGGTASGKVCEDITENGDSQSTSGHSKPGILQSTVCQKIIEALAENSTDKNIHRRVEIISQDCFYKPLSEAQKIAAAKGQFDFDHPDAFDEDLMIKTLKSIQAGQTVKVTEHDFVNHCPDMERVKTIKPADVILFEGILIFYFKKVREMLSMKLFVDTDADTRLARRVERDMKDRGRPLEHILHQYILYVKPAFEEFCLPTKKYADIIIPRGADNLIAIDLIVQHIQDLLRQGKSPDITHSTIPSLSSTASFKLHEDLKFSSVH